MAAVTTIWTEYGVSAGDITTTDHYPLCVMVGDEWSHISTPGKTKSDVIIPFKFRLDSTADYIRFYFTASNGTFIFQVLSSGRIIGEASRTITTEEATYLQVGIKDKHFKSTNIEGEIKLMAKGNWLMKGATMKVVAFYLAGWTEHEATSTSWTEYEVS